MKDKIFKYIFFSISIVIIIVACIFVFTNRVNKSFYTNINNKKVNISNEITIGISEFDTLNPVLTKSLDVQYISKLMFRGLTSITKDFKVENDLALECSKIDNKTYIIKLKEDIKWDNGDSLTADDVKFTIDNLKNIKTIYSENLKHIESVEVIDNYTIKIYLDE